VDGNAALGAACRYEGKGIAGEPSGGGVQGQSVSQSGSFLCSSVGGAGGVRVADESRADGSCGEGGKRSVGLCGPERDLRELRCMGGG
jgi:hypothetical protein